MTIWVHKMSMPPHSTSIWGSMYLPIYLRDPGYTCPPGRSSGRPAPASSTPPAPGVWPFCRRAAAAFAPRPEGQVSGGSHRFGGVFTYCVRSLLAGGTASSRINCETTGGKGGTHGVKRVLKRLLVKVKCEELLQFYRSLGSSKYNMNIWNSNIA